MAFDEQGWLHRMQQDTVGHTGEHEFGHSRMIMRADDDQVRGHGRGGIEEEPCRFTKLAKAGVALEYRSAAS